ncbi:MAG: hypothetical protein ACRD7E_06115, partial [Bryobacteraceae bacterium]
YRVAGTAPDQAAFPVLAMLVALALSTHSQCLFGLDGADAMARYRLYPLKCRQILAAKNAAFLIVLCCLTAPLSLLPGLASGMAVLAIGNRNSVLKSFPQRRWRFAGAAFPVGCLQIIALFFAGSVVTHADARWILACALAWLASLWHYGRVWDRLIVAVRRNDT